MAQSAQARSRSTTDGWLVFHENREATAAVDRAVAQVAAKSPTVLYIAGPEGSGKTHLLSRFEAQCRRQRGRLRVLVLSAIAYADQLTAGRSGSSLYEFADRFTSVDLLAIEDLHLIAHRSDPQERLAYIIDQLLENNRSVAITAHKRPGQLNLMTRLRSRCHAAITAQLDLPSQQSRRAFLNTLAQQRQLALPPRILTHLARHPESRPGNLIGMLDALERADRDLSDMDKRLLDQLLSQDGQAGEIRTSDITRQVSSHFGVRVRDLRSSGRRQELASARQIAMYLARELTDQPVIQIAKYFGRDNHSAVSHAHRRIRDRLKEETQLRQHVELIRTHVLSSR